MFALPVEKPKDENEWLETATDQAIEACGGDMRAALEAALIAMTMMESELSDVYASVSRGFARGKLKDSHDG
jgi:ribonuclease PH